MIAFLGIAVLLGLAALGSTNRRRIVWRPVVVAMLLQFLLAGLVLRTRWGAIFFEAVNVAAAGFIAAADVGIDFLFGTWPDRVSIRPGYGCLPCRASTELAQRSHRIAEADLAEGRPARNSRCQTSFAVLVTHGLELRRLSCSSTRP